MTGFEAMFFVESVLVIMGVTIFIAYIANAKRKVKLLESKVYRLERRLGRRYK